MPLPDLECALKITRRDDLRKYQLRANVGTGVLGGGFAVVVLGVAYLVASGIGLSLPDSGYVIDRHHVEASIDGADLHVVERIEATYLEGRRGIVRDLPTEPPHRGEALVYDDIEVTSTSHPDVGVEVTRFTDLVEVRIGDADRTITGSADYTLRYTIRGLTVDRGGEATVRFDALLYDWDTTVTDGAITLAAPAAGEAVFSCVYGRIGGTTPCQEPTVDGSSATWTFDGPLRHREGATVQAVLADAPVNDLPDSRLGALAGTPVRVDPILAVIALAPIGAAVIGARPLRRRHIRDLVAGAEVVYHPPPGMDPATAAASLDRPPDLVNGYLATILDLARRGHLRLSRQDAGPLWVTAGQGDGASARHGELLRQLTTTTDGVSTTSRLDQAAGVPASIAAFQRSYPAHVISEGFSVRRVLRWLILAVGVVVVVGPQLPRVLPLGGDIPERLLVYALVAAIAAVPAVLLARWQRRATAPHLAALAPETLRHLIGYRSFLTGHAGTLEFAAEDAGVDLRSAYLQHLPYAVAFGASEAWIERYGPLVEDVGDWVPTTHDDLDALHRAGDRGYRARRRVLAKQRAAQRSSGRSGGTSGRSSVGAGGRGGGSGGGGGRGRSW